MKKLTILIFCILTASVSQAQVNPMAKMTLGELKVSLFNLRSQYQVRVSPAYTDSPVPREAEVFWIKNPSRLVIDIPGYHHATARNVQVNSTEISSMRSGVHKDKIRIVLDIKDGREPGYEQRFDQSGRGLVVNTSFNSGKDLVDINNESFQSAKVEQRPKTIEFTPGKIEAKPKPPRVSLPAPTNMAKDSKLKPLERKAEKTVEKVKNEPSMRNLKEKFKQKIQKTEQVAKTEQPASQARVPQPLKPKIKRTETIVTQTPDPQSTKPAARSVATSSSSTLKGIDFQEIREEKTTAVVLNVESSVQYEMKQAQDDLFELKLSNTKVQGIDISIPHFTPEELYQGFEVVVARQQGKNVVVRIYTDANTKPMAFPNAGMLWIKPVPRVVAPTGQ